MTAILHEPSWTIQLKVCLCCMSACEHKRKKKSDELFTYHSFLAYQIMMFTCFTWTDNSYLTHVISPKTV